MENWERKFEHIHAPDASVPSHREKLRKGIESGKIPAHSHKAVTTLAVTAIILLTGLTVVYPGWAEDLIHDFLVKTITLRTKDGRNVVIKTIRSDGSAAPCDTTCKMVVVRATSEGLKVVDPSTETFTISSTNDDQTWIINGDTLNANSMTVSKGDPGVFDLDRLSKLNNPAAQQDTKVESTADFDLFPNYPNPFNPGTTIAFNLKQAGPVTLKVYNLMGQEITTLLNGYTETGHHTVHFDGTNLPSGMYLYTLKTAAYQNSKMMILAK